MGVLLALAGPPTRRSRYRHGDRRQPASRAVAMDDGDLEPWGSCPSRNSFTRLDDSSEASSSNIATKGVSQRDAWLILPPHSSLERGVRDHMTLTLPLLPPPRTRSGRGSGQRRQRCEGSIFSQSASTIPPFPGEGVEKLERRRASPRRGSSTSERGRHPSKHQGFNGRASDGGVVWG